MREGSLNLNFEVHYNLKLLAVVAHNRFHYNCCNDPPPRKPTVEEVKAKSLANSVIAQKRRRERSSQRTGFAIVTYTPYQTAESLILNRGKRSALRLTMREFLLEKRFREQSEK